jgi:type IV secretory pathway VirB2 component (pilin)
MNLFLINPVMLNKVKLLKLHIISFLILLAIAAGFFLINPPQLALAQPVRIIDGGSSTPATPASSDPDYGLTAVAEKAGLTSGASATTLPQLLGRIVGAVLALVGVIFLILIVYGGIMWMTAGGNDEKVRKSRGIIINSTIGLIIILAAYAIVNFVFTTVLTATKK